MNLSVVRYIFGEKATIGKLSIDGVFFSYTLEDKVRPVGIKIQNQTAIPVGVYEVTIDQSQRFGRLMPHVLNVPNFTGIRIHWGNSDVSTDGCILLGMTHKATDMDFIGESRIAFEKFFPRLQEGLKQGKVFIQIA